MTDTILSSLKGHWGHLLKEGQELTFKKGQVLFYEGHNPYGLMVLRSGKVSFQEGADPCRGEHMVPVAKGEVIGVEPFFSESPYCCTCVATEDCRVTFIPKSLLLSLKEDQK